jgi:hypothetical protein
MSHEYHRYTQAMAVNNESDREHSFIVKIVVKTLTSSDESAHAQR